MNIKETIYNLLPVFFIMLAFFIFTKDWLKGRKIKDSLAFYILSVFVTYPALYFTDLLFIPFLQYCHLPVEDFLTWIHNQQNFEYVLTVLVIIGLFDWIYILLRGFIRLSVKLIKRLMLRLREKKRV